MEQTALMVSATSWNDSPQRALATGQFRKESPQLIFSLLVAAVAVARVQPVAVAVAALQRPMVIQSCPARSLMFRLAQVVREHQVHLPQTDRMVHHLASCETH
jgi:hypothetical protein